MRRRTTLLAGTLAVLAGGTLPAARATAAAVQDNVVHVRNVPGSTGGHAVVEGDRLYVGAYGLGMRIFDISDPANPVQIGQYYGPASDMPGARADAVPDAAVLDGRHIATLNSTNRVPGTQQTEFLDVTDPAAPELLYRFNAQNGTPSGEAHNGDIVDSRRLWLPSGNAMPSFRIYLLDPLLQTPAAAPSLVFGGNLVTMWLDSPLRGGRPIGPEVFTHIHDLEVYTDLPVLLPEAEWVDQDGDEVPDPTYAPRDLVFAAEGGNYVNGANSGSMFVVDITDPTKPVVRNRFLHTGATGHHAWRYFHEVQLLDGDRHIGLISDEDLHSGCDAGGLMSVRFSDDYTQTTELDEWFIGTGTPGAVCSAHVFSSKGDHVFMGSYNAGLQIVDLSNPADLKRAGQYIAEGANSWGALYHRGYIYVGDFGARGLDVFQLIPSSDAEGLVKAGNPASRSVSGLSEAAAMCDPASPASSLDALIVPIPPDKRDGFHVIRGVTSTWPATELDIWFLDAGCKLMDGGMASNNGGEERGLINEGAHFAAVTLWTGGPGHVYVQLDPE